MYNLGSFDAFIVKPTILPEICSTNTGDDLKRFKLINDQTSD